MRRVCAWCQKELGVTTWGDPEAITHGICPTCRAKVVASATTRSLGTILDNLEVPVLFVAGNGEIRGANSPMKTILRKTDSDIDARLTGDVFDCVNARLPGGCGRTEHCQGCVIRQTVLRAYEEGGVFTNIVASMKIATEDGTQSRLYRLSAEKVNDGVVLRFDEIKESA